MRHALGHGHLDADGEDVVAGEPAPHAVLVGMHHDRVVVEDEERAQRRIDVVGDEVPTDVVDGQPARSRGYQVRPLQLRRRLRKRVARAEDDTAPLAELAEQRW